MPIIKKYKFILYFVVLFVVAGGLLSASYAINTTSNGHQFTSLQNKSITLADNSCRRVTNNATNRFIPTRTMGEWNSFNAIAASQGVAIANCCRTEYSCYTASCCSTYQVFQGDFLPTGGICGALSCFGWYGCYDCQQCEPYTVCS